MRAQMEQTFANCEPFEVATPIRTTVVVTTLAGPCSIVEIAQGK
jgi:hypothetical protein